MIAKLEMFISLAREQHFGRAAESLGITQPTLSAGIKQLEDILGVRLVNRGSRFGGLTPEGQQALIRARQIVGDARSLREEMRFAREGLSGKIRLAVIPTALTWASHISAMFAQDHPNVSFTILSRASTEIVDMIENFEADVGLTYLDNEPLGRMQRQEIYRETYALVCHEDAPEAAQNTIGWADLSDLNLCLLTPDMQNRRIINRAFLEAGIDPEIKMESNSTVVLTTHVEAGGWATVLPVQLGRRLASGRALKVVPIREASTAPAVGLIAPHQEPQTPVIASLFEAARLFAG